MEVPISDAKAALTDLVRRAEEGEEIILTRHGKPVARIERVKQPLSQKERKARLEAIMEEGRSQVTPGPSAARSQDFLYDKHGLPK